MRVLLRKRFNFFLSAREWVIAPFLLPRVVAFALLAGLWVCALVAPLHQ
jgi:hypothetical protein